MTDNERAVIEAAVEWQHMREAYGPKSAPVELRAVDLANALNELHNENDGRWEPSDGQGVTRPPPHVNESGVCLTGRGG